METPATENQGSRINQRMPEIVVAATGLVIGNEFWLGSSVGLGYELNKKPVAVVFKQPGGHSVNVYADQSEYSASSLNHVFVSRYAEQVLKIEGDFEVFRVHVTGSRDPEDKKFLYGEEIITFEPTKGLRVRYGFEHIGGKYVIEPYSTIIDILSDKPELWAIPNIDLVPEREAYLKNYTYLPHPGCYNTEEGAAALFEGMLAIKHQKETKVTIH